MKISDNIKKLQDYMELYGDVDLFFEDNDGRFTSIVPYQISITYKANKPKHDGWGTPNTDIVYKYIVGCE